MDFFILEARILNSLSVDKSSLEICGEIRIDVIKAPRKLIEGIKPANSPAKLHVFSGKIEGEKHTRNNLITRHGGINEVNLPLHNVSYCCFKEL